MSPPSSSSDRVFVVVFDPLEVCLSPYHLKEVLSSADVSSVNGFLDANAVRGLSPRSLRTYAYALQSVCEWMSEASLTIDLLTEAHLIGYVTFLRQQGTKGSPPAPRTINLRLSVLKALYRFHSGDDLPKARGVVRSPPSLIRRAPSSEIAFPSRLPRRAVGFSTKVPHRLIVPLTRDEVQGFFTSLQSWRDLGIASLMLFLGLRSCEILELKTDDLDFSEDQLRIRGKGDRERVLPLPVEAKSTIISYLRTERPATSGLNLFVVLKGPARGEPMTPAGLRSIFRYHRRRSETPKANPHRFRHTFAADMVRAGISLPSLMRLMGHSHIQMTLRYVHLSAADVRDEFLKAVRQRTHGDPP